MWFDLCDVAAFDIHIFERPTAANFGPSLVDQESCAAKETLLHTNGRVYQSCT